MDGGPGLDVGLDAASLDAASLDASLDAASLDASPDAPAACATQLTGITDLTAGLFYTSEGDEPLTAQAFAGEGGAAPTPADVVRLSGASAGSTTETRTVDQFFARVVIDPTAAPPISSTRPEELRTAVEGAWRDLSVVRVIDPLEPVRVRVFLVGRSQCNELVWLRSISIET